MDQSHFILKGQTYAISAELRNVLSARLPALGLVNSEPRRGKRLYVCNDEYGRQRALTIFLDRDVDNQMEELTQATRVATLLEGRGFATFVDYGVGHWEDDDEPIVAWVEEWVRGLPLDTVLTKAPHDFSFSHLQRLLLDLAEGIHALRSIGATHGTMNSRNLILFHPHPDSLNPSSSFRMVDLSHARTTRQSEVADELATQRLLEEDRAILETLTQAHNALINDADVSLAQRGWLWSLGDYLIQASKDVEQGQSIQPESLRDLARSRLASVTALPLGAATSLSDPFNYISAEHIASDELLYSIFATSCPWIDDVTRPDPCLIVGPRGCGKSTILRWVSIKTQLAGNADGQQLDQLQVGAFYVSCTAEIQSRVGRFDTLDKAMGYEDELIHYLNLVILREVLSALELMRQRNRADWGIDDAFCQLVLDFVGTQLNAPSAPVAGLPPIAQAYDLTVARLRNAQEALRGATTSDRLTPASFLNDLSVLLARETPFFARHRVTYCLDDYSAHRVPEPVQQIFNRVVFGLRSANYIFKISAENRGFYPYDRAGARIDVEREMKSVDFGASFVALNSQDGGGRAARFARDLLANRLAAAGWAGTPEGLLGATSMSQAEFARMARAAHLNDGPRPLYAGLPTIADLCSGDMATLLLVYRRIFELGGVDETTEAMVPEQVQHNAIRQVSRDMLQLIRSHEPYGQQMLTITQEFCVLARFALENGQVSEHGNLEPMKRTRIEIDGLSLPELELGNSSESGLVKELIRRAVFLDLGPGDSRHRERVTTRLMMRRIFLPAFQLSLAKNGQFAWSEKQFLRFLQNPAGIRLDEQRKISRSPDVSEEELLFTWPGDSEQGEGS